MKVNDTRTLCPDAQEQLRRRVVAAIRNDGMNKGQAARTFHVSRTSINTRLEACEAGGSAALRSGKRFGCNMISAVTNQGQRSFMVFRERFTARVFIRFLGRLLRQPHLRGRKCFRIVDGHPVHKSAMVKRWIAARDGQIEKFLLPGYSPELNPDELLNQDVNSSDLGRERPAARKHRMHRTRTCLRSTQRRPEAVRSCFQEEHVRYGADPEMFNYECSG